MERRKASSMNGNRTLPTSKRLLELLLERYQKVLADNGDDRNGTFQILADGTQDLAALVGLFATDSVERYSVNYSRGYLSVAAATCSLFGIMGYVRALVKLGLGSGLCQGSGFPTAPVRAILGVAGSDRLPKDELVTVSYISRTTNESDDTVQFRALKSLNHTRESFSVAWPIFWQNASSRKGADRNILYNYSASRSDLRILTPIWGSLLLTAAATSFPITLVSHHWTWTRMVASFGMFFALATSSMMWAYVYVKEQIPYWSSSSSTRRSDILRLEEFAVIELLQPNSRQTIASLRTVTGPLEWICRVLSSVAAVVISLGYICQYIEIRRTTTTQSAWWLGFQAALAVVRMIIWIWSPVLNRHKTFLKTHPVQPDRSSRFSGPDLAIIYFSVASSLNKPKLTFPSLLLDRLEQMPTLSMLKQAKDIASSELSEPMRHKLLNKCTAVWNFPIYVFGRWIADWSGNAQRVREPSSYYSYTLINIGGSKPWVDGEIILVPVLWTYRCTGQVATTPYNSSSTIYFDGLKKNPRPSEAPLRWYPKGDEPLDRALAELLGELSEAIEAMEKLSPQPAGSENTPVSVHERPIPHNGSEVVVEMENMTDTPPIQPIPLPNSAAPHATTTALP